MENTITFYLTNAQLWLCTTTLIYFFMNGAQIFETLVFVPKWTVSPPENFKLLLDGRGVSLKLFWILFHSLHEISFVLAIVFCWEIELIRNWLLILFAIHFAVRIWTLSYFAPNIIRFQKIAETESREENLLSKVSAWQKLNYLRVAIFMAVSIGLIPLCIYLFKLGY